MTRRCFHNLFYAVYLILSLSLFYSAYYFHKIGDSDWKPIFGFAIITFIMTVYGYFRYKDYKVKPKN